MKPLQMAVESKMDWNDYQTSVRKSIFGAGLIYR